LKQKYEQTEADKKFFQSINNQTDYLNSHIYNMEAINAVNMLSNEITLEKTKRDNIEALETTLKSYKEKEIIPKDLLELINNTESLTFDELTDVYKEAETCLITLGGA
jgi:hypothetical protein